jgi:MOSC domain
MARELGALSVAAFDATHPVALEQFFRDLAEPIDRVMVTVGGRRPGVHRRPVPDRRRGFEVTQPRVTCFRVGIRMNDPQMPARLVSHHRPGFYFRVLTEGALQAGQEIIKVASGPAS